jgi:hypothetical protein
MQIKKKFSATQIMLEIVEAYHHRNISVCFVKVFSIHLKRQACLMTETKINSYESLAFKPSSTLASTVWWAPIDSLGKYKMQWTMRFRKSTWTRVICKAGWIRW